MNPYLELQQTLTRRHFFQRCQIGLAGAALAGLAGPGLLRAEQDRADNPLAPKQSHFEAKARAVIYLHMAGSPTTLDLFDYKPMLQKFDGQDCPQEFLEGMRFAFIKGVPKLLGSPFKFHQHGQAGTWMSELLPHMATVADEIAVIRSMKTDHFNHAPAQLFMHTGNSRLGHASMGSWATYGLGTENQDLPGFVVLASGGRLPSAGKSVWGSGFLPSVYQGVQCRTQGEPVLYLSDPTGVSRSMRRKTLDALRDLNEIQQRKFGDPETLARISQYELAYRMQISVPEVMDISREPDSIQTLYGTEPGKVSFANNCLLARRLVESGVRYVQLFDWGWDHHGAQLREDIRYALPKRAKEVDRPLAALVKDLKRRGLLDHTLIVWGGEFGRTPMRENRREKGEYVGRDHHPHGFTMWMAGGGIKPGLNYGATDEIGFHAVEDVVHVHDLQATILHQLGFNAHALSFPFQGLNQRLIGPTNDPKVVEALLT
jgi:hypothetical protein